MGFHKNLSWAILAPERFDDALIYWRIETFDAQHEGFHPEPIHGRTPLLCIQHTIIKWSRSKLCDKTVVMI